MWGVCLPPCCEVAKLKFHKRLPKTARLKTYKTDPDFSRRPLRRSPLYSSAGCLGVDFTTATVKSRTAGFCLLKTTENRLFNATSAEPMAQHGSTAFTSSQRCLHCQEGTLIMWKDGRATFTLLLPVVCCILAALRCLTCHVLLFFLDIGFLLHNITPVYPVSLAVSQNW